MSLPVGKTLVCTVLKIYWGPDMFLGLRKEKFRKISAVSGQILGKDIYSFA
jgi:hypothetical protein